MSVSLNLDGWIKDKLDITINVYGNVNNYVDYLVLFGLNSKT